MLLLIGSGHAHLFVLEALARGRLGRVRAVLVSPEPYHVYSGMLTGLIGGLYAEDEVRLDLPAIAKGAGAEFIAGRVTAIQPSEGRVRLEDGELLAYDVLSLAIGASVTAPRVSGGTMA
nr:hypothetical protein [Gemmatimonadales bacterium]